MQCAAVNTRLGEIIAPEQSQFGPVTKTTVEERGSESSESLVCHVMAKALKASRVEKIIERYERALLDIGIHPSETLTGDSILKL